MVGWQGSRRIKTSQPSQVLVSSKIKVSNQLTISHDASFGRSTGTSMHATASIEQPAYGYAGPILLRVYLDTLFNTFLFSLEN